MDVYITSYALSDASAPGGESGGGSRSISNTKVWLWGVADPPRRMEIPQISSEQNGKPAHTQIFLFLKVLPSFPTTGILSPKSFLELCHVAGPLLLFHASFLSFYPLSLDTLHLYACLTFSSLPVKSAKFLSVCTPD